MEPQPEQKTRRSWTGVLLALVVLILIVFVAFFALPNLPKFGNYLNGSNSTLTYHLNNGSNSTVSSNTIAGSTVEITYPPNYSILADYSLSIINENRTGFNVSSVTLSPIPSGQQHADSMLQNDYFSHWDTQGYKPYMRYTLLNGTGFVEENVAYEFTSLPAYTSTQSVEKAINDLQWQMMYNDSACCNNGHKDNILNPFHDRVSIGISYDSTHVYLVEDFENYYINLATPISSPSGTVKIVGNTSEQLSPTSVLVFYDSTPQALTSQTLNTNYDGPYSPGTFVGGAVPPCNSLFGSCQQFSTGLTVHASTWKVSSSSIDIEFSINAFIQQNGNGVYTITLAQGESNNPEYLTSISIFVSS